jgi:glucose-6-phosphate isomerase
VLPYDDSLGRFPAYLQQLCMESLGKSVTLSGDPVGVDTGAIVFGEPGTNGQHSFYQLLHQGTTLVPADVIVVAQPAHALRHHHDLLVANAIAQAEALAFGQSPDELRAEGVPESLVPHKATPGNRPTTTLLVGRLTPFALGALIALYEHAVFAQAVVLGVDPFDQWGVELGKRLAGAVVATFTGEGAAGRHDPSTDALVRRYLALREEG